MDTGLRPLYELLRASFVSGGDTAPSRQALLRAFVHITARGYELLRNALGCGAGSTVEQRMLGRLPPGVMASMTLQQRIAHFVDVCSDALEFGPRNERLFVAVARIEGLDGAAQFCDAVYAIAARDAAIADLRRELADDRAAARTAIARLAELERDTAAKLAVMSKRIGDLQNGMVAATPWASPVAVPASSPVVAGPAPSVPDPVARVVIYDINGTLDQVWQPTPENRHDFTLQCTNQEQVLAFLSSFENLRNCSSVYKNSKKGYETAGQCKEIALDTILSMHVGVAQLTYALNQACNNSCATNCVHYADTGLPCPAERARKR